MKFVDPFVTKYCYHLYNKTIDDFTPFSDDSFSQHYIDLARYYRSGNCKVSYSCYIKSPPDIKEQFNKDIIDPNYFQIEIIAYCLMPNHYHFLLRQKINGGIFNFMNNVSNAFTRYFNIINLRIGPLFIPQYKSRLIANEEQLIHVSRYIHLNPYAAGLVNSVDDLYHYRFSSLKEYVGNNGLSDKSIILNTDYFLNNIAKYKAFIDNHADYQKSLEYIKYVEKWE